MGQPTSQCESSNSVWTRDEASLIETPFLIIQLNQWAKRHRGVSENQQEQTSQPSQPPPVPPPDTPPKGPTGMCFWMGYWLISALKEVLYVVKSSRDIGVMIYVVTMDPYFSTNIPAVFLRSVQRRSNQWLVTFIQEGIDRTFEVGEVVISVDEIHGTWKDIDMMILNHFRLQLKYTLVAD